MADQVWAESHGLLNPKPGKVFSPTEGEDKKTLWLNLGFASGEEALLKGVISGRAMNSEGLRRKEYKGIHFTPRLELEVTRPTKKLE